MKKVKKSKSQVKVMTFFFWDFKKSHDFDLTWLCHLSLKSGSRPTPDQEGESKLKFKREGERFIFKKYRKTLYSVNGTT
jgi:hypothetical protein